VPETTVIRWPGCRVKPSWAATSPPPPHLAMSDTSDLQDWRIAIEGDGMFDRLGPYDTNEVMRISIFATTTLSSGGEWFPTVVEVPVLDMRPIAQMSEWSAELDAEATEVIEAFLPAVALALDLDE
jgi:hypothetical protein